MKLNLKHTHRFSTRYCSRVKLTFLQQSRWELQVFWDIMPWQLVVTEILEQLATSLFGYQWKTEPWRWRQQEIYCSLWRLIPQDLNLLLIFWKLVSATAYLAGYVT